MHEKGFHPKFKESFNKLKAYLSSEDFSRLENRFRNSLSNFEKKGVKGLTCAGSREIYGKIYLIYEQCLINDEYYEIYLYLTEYKKKVILLDIGELKGKTHT